VSKLGLKAKEVMTKMPNTIGKEELAIEAARRMENYRVTALLVIDRKKRPEGVIHLHDLMQAKVV